MTKSYKVALLVNPDVRGPLATVSLQTRTWLVSTATNAAAERISAARPEQQYRMRRHLHQSSMSVVRSIAHDKVGALRSAEEDWECESLMIASDR